MSIPSPSLPPQPHHPPLSASLQLSKSQLQSLLSQMISDPSMLSTGYKTLSQYETSPYFYRYLLELGLSKDSSDHLKKLSTSTFLTFLYKNYSRDNNTISDNEKLNLVSYMLDNLTTNDYYIKNFLSKSLGYIAAKEFPYCYDSFIQILLSKLKDNSTENGNENEIDTILRIFISVLKHCDDSCANITFEVLPIIINIFKVSKYNQKNREKCLIIISLLLNKLSFADGNDMELLEKSLDSNSLMENSLSLFTSILVSNPKMLLDIKKWTIRILDIMVRDMPIYSSKFFNYLIEPTWRLIVLELSLYGDSVIFNKDIEYTDEEEITMEEENHIYDHGYESEDEEEERGMQGLILELIDFTIDLLKRGSVIEALRPALYNFLLCIKGYLLMPHNSFVLWKNNPNLYISEEYDEENVNSIRNKTLGLIREISKEIDDDALFQFIHLIINELTQGIVIDNYKEVIKLDDYNLVEPYLNKLNNDTLYLQTRQESNLLILGTISDDLLRLKEKQIIPQSEIKHLITFLLEIISSPNKDNSILVGRTIWTLSKLLCLVRNDIDMLTNIFNSVSQTMCNAKSDLSIKLVSAQCISIICQRLIASKKQIESDYIINDYDALVELLTKVNEDTIFIPVENFLFLSKLNKQKALYVPLKHVVPVLKVYSENFNDPFLGHKLLELIKMWCEDKASACALIEKFIPIAIKVFEDFYKNNNVGKANSNFEIVKQTVMTEHSNPDISTSSEMLPNLIDIITMLIKYCADNKDERNLMWISLIIKALCDILLLTNDVTILQRGASLLRFYIALCKDTIIKQNQIEIIITVIQRYFDSTLLESSMLYLGNVIAQFFFHLENKIIPSILENIVKRIYKAKMPSIVQSLILVYSRFISKFPVDTLDFLTKIQVENRVGLKVLIDKWLLHQPLFRGKYFKNISIRALANLYSMKNNIVESLMVIGYNPSHSTASVEVNAPCKILSVLVRCLNNEIMQEKIKNDKTNYDDMDDNDNDSDNNNSNDDNNDNDSFKDEDDNKVNINEDEFKDITDEPRDFSSKLPFLNTKGESGGLGNLEQGSEIYLTEMLGFDYNDIEGDEDETTEDDLIYLTDIDANFELKEYLMEFFTLFYKSDKEYLMECLKLLPKEDQKMFKTFGIVTDANK